MTPYQTLTQPWRQAFAVWTVMAQAQTEFTLRMMGLTAPRLAARRASPATVVALPRAPEPVATPELVALAEAPVVDEVAATPEPSAEVVHLRLVTEASTPAIAAATAPDALALPEAEAVAAPFVAEEPFQEEPLAVLAEPAHEGHEDLVQAAVQALVAEDDAPAALENLLPEAAAAATSRRTSTGSRRAPKAKRSS